MTFGHMAMRVGGGSRHNRWAELFQLNSAFGQQWQIEYFETG